MSLCTVTLKIVPRVTATKRDHIAMAVREALYQLYERQNMIEAWSGFVSQMLRHPDCMEHPVIWDGTEKITSGKVWSIEGLRQLLEETAKAERA